MKKLLNIKHTPYGVDSIDRSESIRGNGGVYSDKGGGGSCGSRCGSSCSGGGGSRCSGGGCGGSGH